VLPLRTASSESSDYDTSSIVPKVRQFKLMPLLSQAHEETVCGMAYDAVDSKYSATRTFAVLPTEAVRYVKGSEFLAMHTQHSLDCLLRHSSKTQIRGLGSNWAD
jgi:hypothetical protein